MRVWVCVCVCVHTFVVVSQPVSRCQGAGGLQMVVIPLWQRQEGRDCEREKQWKEGEREREKINGACEEQKDREERERERESDKRQLRGSSRPNSGNIANTQLCLRGRSVQGNWWSENTSEMCSLHLRQCFWELTPPRSEAQFTFVFYSHSKIFHSRSV